MSSRPPRTRADCVDGPRPCPWRACRFHLAPEIGRGRPRETCVLDVAAAGGLTLGEVGEILRVSRERVRQIETVALRKLHARLGSAEALEG